MNESKTCEQRCIALLRMRFRGIEMGTLPDSECRYGYTHDQLTQILGDRLAEFEGWMDGQTMMICNGQRWNPITEQPEPDYDDKGIPSWNDRLSTGSPTIPRRSAGN